MVLVASSRLQATGGHLKQQAACCCCCCPEPSQRQPRPSSLVALARGPNGKQQPAPERCKSKSAATKRRLFPQRPASSKRPAAPEDPAADDCVKCQLLVRWTSAQALLTSARAAEARNEATGKMPQEAPTKQKSARHRSPQRDALACAQSGCHLRQTRNFRPSRTRQASGRPARSQQPPRPPEDEEPEISSLTESSLNNGPQDELDADKWSLSSCYEKARARKAAQPDGPQRLHQRAPSIRAKVRLVPPGRQKRRPAPLPPGGGRSARRWQQQHQLRRRSDNSADSGNTSGTDTSRLSAGDSRAPDQQMAQISSKTGAPSSASTSTTTNATSGTTSTTIATATEPTPATADANRVVKANLLSETEVYSIEHFLRSHKSSIYVCGCMANLYLTSTRLVDNGRCSKPAAEGWQLSQTGVPVLTFDSGLTRNRDRRRLSINLAERGSGFVLWSDIIDHLSNYRAFCSELHGPADATSGGAGGAVCETFHVMYLSSNHRIMVGLSFDDATCARYFLRQVELVTSDPANIALTGPKLAHRIASVGRLGRLLAPGRKTAAAEPASEWSSGSELEHAQATEARGKEKARQSRLSRLIAATRQSEGGSNDAGGEYTWSTLKRAIRFGHQSRTARAARAADSGPTGPAFQPKPLAALAAAGRVYRAGKRMPRKCDISAPCLFQHVTRVDLDNLERLHSRSLVSAAGGDPPKSLSTSAGDSHSSAPEASCPPDGPDRYRKLSLISRADRSTAANSTSSSCYSSASISPANSECGARQVGRPAARNGRGQPPKVPQRSSSTELRSGASQAPAEAPPPPVAAGNKKIQAIIRELQAQASAELIDAKRKLMADIADQVVARGSAFAASSSGSSASSFCTSSSASSSSEGAISRL